MDMITIPVTIPKDMAPYLDWEEKRLSFEQNAMLLYPLIHNLVISHGRAAEILGVRKWDLIEFYNKMGIPYLNQSKEDLDEEIAGFARLKDRKVV